MTSRVDRWLDKLIGRTRETNRRLADLLHQAQQLRLATEVSVEVDTKNRERTQGVAADRAKHGDSSPTRVDHDPTSLTHFGKIVEPSLAPEKT